MMTNSSHEPKLETPSWAVPQTPTVAQQTPMAAPWDTGPSAPISRQTPTAPPWEAQRQPAGEAGADVEAGPRFGEHVLRGNRAGNPAAARFSIDLRNIAVTEATVRQANLRGDAEAHAMGYAAGWAEGRRAAAAAALDEIEQVKARGLVAEAANAAVIDRAVGALAAAAARLDQRATPDLEELERIVVAVAFALAEAVVGRELAVATEPGGDAIARALAVAPASGPVTLRLHPADLATLAETGGVAGVLTVAGRTVTVGPDPSLEPGDAVAECDTTTVDARLGAALDRMREVVLGVQR